MVRARSRKRQSVEQYSWHPSVGVETEYSSHEGHADRDLGIMVQLHTSARERVEPYTQYDYSLTIAWDAASMHWSVVPGSGNLTSVGW